MKRESTQSPINSNAQLGKSKGMERESHVYLLLERADKHYIR